jgi:hypothetical protein
MGAFAFSSGFAKGYGAPVVGGLIEDAGLLFMVGGLSYGFTSFVMQTTSCY